jgi:hypothetical protein
MWILVSASTTRVFVAFSMVNFVLPFCRLLIVHTKLEAHSIFMQVSTTSMVAALSLPPPSRFSELFLTFPARRPMHRDMCSPRSVCRAVKQQ